MTFVCKDFVDAQDYHQKFENSLFKAKGITLALLILISIVYQINNKNVANSKTLLSSQEGKKRVIAESLTTALFGVFSLIFVVVLRSGVGQVFTLNTLKNVLVISLILGLFCFAQESAGLNRYLAEKETVEKSGLYYDIDEQENEKEEPVYKNDPFISSTGYVLIIILATIVIVYCFNMVRITHCGYTSGLYNISDSNFTHTLGLSSATKTFIAELTIVGLLNCIPPFLSTTIRGEKFSTKSGALAVFTLVIASVLQFMFQYSGIFHSNKVSDINQFEKLSELNHNDFLKDFK